MNTEYLSTHIQELVLIGTIFLFLACLTMVVFVIVIKRRIHFIQTQIERREKGQLPILKELQDQKQEIKNRIVELERSM